MDDMLDPDDGEAARLSSRMTSTSSLASASSGRRRSRRAAAPTGRWRARGEFEALAVDEPSVSARRLATPVMPVVVNESAARA